MRTTHYFKKILLSLACCAPLFTHAYQCPDPSELTVQYATNPFAFNELILPVGWKMALGTSTHLLGDKNTHYQFKFQGAHADVNNPNIKPGPFYCNYLEYVNPVNLFIITSESPMISANTAEELLKKGWQATPGSLYCTGGGTVAACQW